MIDPQLDDFSGLLSKTFRYEVPRNQRPFTWDNQQISDLLDDLDSSKDSPLAPYLGSFIFDVSHQSQGTIYIVDGQQRFTTLYILLLACRDRAKDLQDYGLSTTIQNELTFYEKHSGLSKGPRLIASESIRCLLDHMCTSDWNTLAEEHQFPPKLGVQHIKLQVRQLRPIYTNFRDKLALFNLAQLQQMLKIIWEIRLTRIYIDSDEEAFSIFERTNARGVELEISDLVQNLLFEKDHPELEKGWKVILRNANHNVSRMLKGFYTSERGYVKKDRLYKALKNYSIDIGGVTAFIEKLTLYSEFFYLLRTVNGEDEVARFFKKVEFDALYRDADKAAQSYCHLQGLRLFKISQVYPLIYSALNCLLRLEDAKSSKTAKSFNGLLQLLENYHFVNNAICERVGNEVEKLYAEYCEEFAKSKDFTETFSKLRAALIAKRAKKPEFIERFCELAYRNNSQTLALLAYIFDRQANFGRKSGERVRLFRPDKDLKKRHYNIEHIYPQKPKSGAVLDETALHNIGNLLLIGVSSNSSLQNDSPQEKIEKIRGPFGKKVENLLQVKEFIETWGDRVEKWDSEVIRERAIAEANEAYSKIWAL